VEHGEYPILKEYCDRWEVEVLDQTVRPWLVRVTTFTGPGAEQMARSMYDSIR
jgi:hypothetical protein